MALMAFPYAFFLTAPYSESLFLAAAISSLLFARRGLWLLAIAMAYLAGLARMTAIVLVLPLVWEYARQRGWLSPATWKSGWLEPARWRGLGVGSIVALAVPSAIGTYMGYVWWRFHDPLAFCTPSRAPNGDDSSCRPGARSSSSSVT